MEKQEGGKKTKYDPALDNKRSMNNAAKERQKPAGNKSKYKNRSKSR